MASHRGNLCRFAHAEGITVHIDGRRAPVKVLLDSLYRPFGNAGKPFHESFRIGAGWGRTVDSRGRLMTYGYTIASSTEDEIAAWQ